ncbi:alpha/beta fold hydrolase [Rhodospirillum centenum]|uniref:Alpha/beta hydrolase superfamily protein n=1 Tax=Rhodospirillum centenum (strain ATCC 51521 / SW) TaxID=414684 RepID=B6ITT8_RHOCS|nr:alpha/beta hydrolase [Rhodospirillum centenum]ACI99474.1 alpha/beta hydrolase superfamily protein [Rhodospirillum centenum SW]
MTRAYSPLPPAVAGDFRETVGRAGRLGFYVGGPMPGDGEHPLLLIHSINAAGSAYEVRPIFERAVRTRRVFAVDLPGFGRSDRSDRRYDPRLYTDAVHEMLDVIAAEHGMRPVDVLALSLSSEFAARATAERPERVRTLTLVTPTGFSRPESRVMRVPGGTREVPGLYAALSVRLWSQGLYDLLVKPRSIRYFLKRTWGADHFDEGLADYDDLTTHQPGARFAPLAFLSGRLFSADIRLVYEKLALPVWVPHATRGDFQNFSGAGWARNLPNWHFQPCPTGALPHFEMPDVFMADLYRFLAQTRAEAA